MGECTHGGFCNFMHLRPISWNLWQQLFGQGPRHRSPTRSHTRHRPQERKRRRSPHHRHGRF
uniref:U2 small nuclear RNA auxiliary factor 1 like 4 n=1 Tax=Rousettus aegyptiacus TaxID=9407 RepID=A0A7J8CML9_ROUAE|nr:U2 small nuclear RNA auxiliary factor 1 like 4 [Rousettus aegyptiacus]